MTHPDTEPQITRHGALAAWEGEFETVPPVIWDALETHWEDGFDADPDDLRNALEFCEGHEMAPEKLARAIALVGETWPSDPDNWPRESMMVDAVEHLAIIVAGIENQLISGAPRDGHNLWKAYAGGPYDSEGKAAYAALESCGGMGYMEGLDRFHIADEEIPHDRIHDAQVIANNTGDAPKWVEVDELGWVLFNQHQ